MEGYKLWLAKFITRLVLIVSVPFVLLLIVVIFSAGGPRVAVVEVRGVIQDSHDVITALYKQLDNTQVKAIVLRVDSPGGAVGPSQEIFEAVKRIREKKPVVASMGSVAASGGLYASLGASKILCQEGTQTGSIGVILQIPNVSKLADKAGVEMVTVKAGKLKDAGNMFREMTLEEREYLDRTTNLIHEGFINAVASSRSLPIDSVRTFADGRVIVGKEAKELGLVDGYGDVYDAARLALELAKAPVPADEVPKVMFVNRKDSFLGKLAETVVDLPIRVVERASSRVPEWQFLSY